MYENNPATNTETVGRYTARTFGWMFLGLAVTFAVMVAAYMTGLSLALLSVPAILVLTLVELAVVFKLSASVGKISVGMSRGLFFLYAVINGLVFSTYFLYFKVPSLVFAFGVTALYFGVMAAVGYFTSVDLSRIRTLLFGGLILLIVFNLLGMFFGFGATERLICFAGVALFLAFTAYDTQKIKAYYAAYQYDARMLASVSIFAALQLYLDFINLFVHILRIFGDRN